jgi:hypothetical protein
MIVIPEKRAKIYDLVHLGAAVIPLIMILARTASGLSNPENDNVNILE